MTPWISLDFFLYPLVLGGPLVVDFERLSHLVVATLSRCGVSLTIFNHFLVESLSKCGDPDLPIYLGYISGRFRIK